MRNKTAMKNLLILGGSQQIGRRLIEKLLQYKNQEYNITIFNRGLTNPHLFIDDVEKIVGDRNTKDIEKLINRDWDIILDCSCYRPIPLRHFLDAIKGRVGQYIFISTISVYDYAQNIGVNKSINEDFPLLEYSEEQITHDGLRFYAQKKVAAEQFLMESDLNAIIFRPHFLYGIYDWQNLDYYWIDRIKKYDNVLLPDNGQDAIHRTYIDELINILQQAFRLEKRSSIYNITTHPPISLKSYTAEVAKILQKETKFISVEKDILLEEKIRPVIDIPLWSNGSHFTFSNTKLETDFNTNFKSHFLSMQETLAWNEKIADQKEGKSKWEAGKFGLSREKELNLMGLK